MKSTDRRTIDTKEQMQKASMIRQNNSPLAQNASRFIHNQRMSVDSASKAGLHGSVALKKGKGTAALVDEMQSRSKQLMYGAKSVEKVPMIKKNAIIGPSQLL